MDLSSDGLEELGLDAKIIRAVRLDPADLENELGRISALTAYFGEKLATCTEAQLNAEAERKNAESRAWILAKTTMGDLGQKGTVDDVKARAASDSLFKEARTEEINAEVALVRAKNVMDALRAKRDSLFALAQIRVQEMKGDPALREQAAHPGRGAPDFARTAPREG